MLTVVWEAAGYPWWVRLKALLPGGMPWIRKRFRVRPEIEKQLVSISARQMDRRLKAQQRTRGRPYQKDDNAHVEQKDGTPVRKLLCWER